MTELLEKVNPPQSVFTTLPDVTAALKNYGLSTPYVPKSVGPSEKLAKNLQSASERENAKLLANASAKSGIGALRDHVAPRLLPGEVIRWQLAVTLAGGFFFLFIYSYATNKSPF
jgi:hypothetical protein